jgi:hypothetical protein
MVTKREAKEICLEVWVYLADNPNIWYKKGLPNTLYKKIEHLDKRCPLCELYAPNCVDCPLSEAGERCDLYDSAYDEWVNSGLYSTNIRKRAALRIVEIVSAWEPEEEDDDEERS